MSEHRLIVQVGMEMTFTAEEWGEIGRAVKHDLPDIAKEIFAVLHKRREILGQERPSAGSRHVQVDAA